MTPFSSRADTAIDDERFASLPGEVPDTLRAVTRVALDIFASTHDFFALHLVPGAHAYRILFEYAGADRNQLFLLGIAAGYLAVNAPAFLLERSVVRIHGLRVSLALIVVLPVTVKPERHTVWQLGRGDRSIR